MKHEIEFKTRFGGTHKTTTRSGLVVDIQPPTLEQVMSITYIQQTEYLEMPRIIGSPDLLRWFHPINSKIPTHWLPPHMRYHRGSKVWSPREFNTYIAVVYECVVSPNIETLLQRGSGDLLDVIEFIIQNDWSGDSNKAFKRLAQSMLGHKMISICKLFSTTPMELLKWPIPSFELSSALADEHDRLSRMYRQELERKMTEKKIASRHMRGQVEFEGDDVVAEPGMSIDAFNNMTGAR